MALRRMLLVDNERQVHDVVEGLTAADWQIEHAFSGEEAIRLLEAEPKGFDLVVSDLVRPGLTGEAFVEAIHQANPFQPIVFLTGGDASVPRGYGAIIKPPKRGFLSLCLELVVRDEPFIVQVPENYPLRMILERSGIRIVTVPDVETVLAYRLACCDRLRLIVSNVASAREIRQVLPQFTGLLVIDTGDQLGNPTEPYRLTWPCDEKSLAMVARLMATTMNPL